MQLTCIYNLAVGRFLSIILALLTLASATGIVEALHHSKFLDEHESTPHNESTCRICFALHAAKLIDDVPAPQIVFVLQLWRSEPNPLPIAPQRVVLQPACRGPPCC